MFDFPIFDRIRFGHRPRSGRGIARNSLGRDIALTLALKLALLYVLWSVYFSQPVLHSMIEGMDPGRVAAAVVASPTPIDNASKQDQPQ